MDISALLQRLMMIPAPSGYEQEMAAEMQDYLRKYCDEVQLDLLGNCIGMIRGKKEDMPKMMIFGHMDSLGMVVRKVEEDGYVRVDRLGGLPEKVLPGTEFIIRSEDGRWHPAVMGPKSHHVTPPEEKYIVDKITSLALDLGTVSAEEVYRMGIYTGCPAVYKPRTAVLQNGRVAGTSIDNRGACACLIRIAELLSESRPDCTVFLVGTVQEEFNLRGAMMAARTVRPDMAIGLDVTLAGDTKDLNHYFDTSLGKGPCIQLYTFHSRGTLNGNLAHEPLFRLVRDTAKKKGMPLQRTTGVGMLTDASYLQLEGKGVAAVDMGFATRYTHTPVEICDPKDLEDLSVLVAQTALSVKADFHLGRL